MSLGMVMKEKMSGWVCFDEEGEEQSLAFDIRAFTPELLKFGAPRNIMGTMSFGDALTLPVKGSLTLSLKGPEYVLLVNHPDHGDIEIKGAKTYTLSKFVQSLITCPLTVNKAGKAIGKAELVYREPIWRFVFDALRIVKEDKAYLPFQEEV